MHAYSTPTALGSLDAAEIARHLVVNVRATMLLAEAFRAAHEGTAGRRLVHFSSGQRLSLFSRGQRLGPMPGELARPAPPDQGR